MSNQLQQALPGSQGNPFAPQPPLNLGMSNADLLGAMEGRFVAPLGPLSYYQGQQLPQQFWQMGIQPLPQQQAKAPMRAVGTGNPWRPEMQQQAAPAWRR